MNGPMEELARIRKELKVMGININQQTRYFNASQSAAERAFYAMKTAELYGKIDMKVIGCLKSSPGLQINDYQDEGQGACLNINSVTKVD